MKKCTRCGEEKDDNEFQKRSASKDGLTASCKKCLAEYDKIRSKSDKRKKAAAVYAKSQSGIEAGNKAKKKYISKNPIKRKAHIIVGNAIRDKKLFKEPCEICGETKKVNAHHDDYARPLNVRWLCPAHHREWHDSNGEAKNAD